MRGATSIVATLAILVLSSSTGCAAVFRDSKMPVHVESDPPGAKVAAKEGSGAAPFDLPVARAGITEVRVTMPGFEENHGLVRKRINGWWLTADLATCIVPVLLCVPLIADAISGAWYDVDARYRARLVPLGMGAPPNYGEGYIAVRPPAPTPAPTPSAMPVAPPKPASEVSSISDSERKAAARAAYQEGVELQGQKSWPQALARFQYAQRIYDAPTHLLHIAQCMVATGKLVEAQETYETLTHRELAPGAPEPFRDAVEVGKAELAELRPRIPTLRIEVKPAPSQLRNLALLLNGRPLPAEVIGIARPMNPGKYVITATAWGIPPSKPVELTLAERDSKTADVRLGR